jgi:hypothetical protein
MTKSIRIDAEAEEEIALLASRASRSATLAIPTFAERSDELERLLDAYGWDAASELGASPPGLRPCDPEWAARAASPLMTTPHDAARRYDRTTSPVGKHRRR